MKHSIFRNNKKLKSEFDSLERKNEKKRNSFHKELNDHKLEHSQMMEDVNNQLSKYKTNRNK